MNASLWPWAAALPATAPTVSGTEAAIEFGLAVTSTEVEELSAMLCGGFPTGAYEMAWTVEGPNSCSVQMVNPPAHTEGFGLEQTFHRQDGRLEVDFGLYSLPQDHQNHGLARTMARNALLVYERLRVSSVVTYANRLYGGYLWAKWGALPQNAGDCRSALLVRLSQLKTSGFLNGGAADHLREVIEKSNDAELMLNVANAVHDHQPLGKDFIGGFGWNAYWSFEDSEQCARVAAALSECG